MTCEALWGQAAGADSSVAEMMQVDRDQLQSHPRVFLCPQHSPAAVAVQPMCGVLLAGQSLAQGGHRAKSGSKWARRAKGGVRRLDGEGGLGRELSLCLGLSFAFAGWLKAWRWAGGKPPHGKLCSVKGLIWAAEISGIYVSCRAAQTGTAVTMFVLCTLMILI